MKKRNSILVIDVESTCWNTRVESEKNVSEIIEIGVTQLVRDPARSYGPWMLGETVSYPIIPIFGHVSPFCTHLTGWTREELVRTGRTYVDTIDALNRRFDPMNAVVACWGKYDDKMFQEMSKLHRVKYPFNNDYLNVKALYATLYTGAMGVGEALEQVGMEFEGRQHNGADDSRNIAKLLLRVINKL